MKKSQIKLGVLLSYASVIIINIIGLVYVPIMLRYMGQVEYGLYSLISSIIGYLTILDLGFGNAIIIYTSKFRALNKQEEEKKLHGMFFLIYTIIGLVTALLGLILYLNVNNMFSSTMNAIEIEKAKTLMLILTINMVFTFPLSIFSSIITAHEEFIFGKLANLVRIILNPLIMLPLLMIGYKSIAMAVITTALNLCVLISYAIYCILKLKTRFNFKDFDFKLLKEIFSYSFFIFLAVIVDKVNWSLDQLILGATVGTIMVAIYSVASQINSIYLSFSTAISGILLPKMSKMIANGAKEEEISDEFTKTGRIQFLILGVILFGFIIFGKDFINLWAGSAYTTAYYIVLILMVPTTIPIIQNVGINILQAQNRVKFRSIICTFMAVLNVAISIPLSKTYGGIGAATGTAISLILGNIIIMNVYYHEKIKIDMPKFWKQIFKIAIPIILISIPIYLLYNIVELSPIIKLAVGVPTYFIIYLFVVRKYAMNFYEKELVFSPIKRYFEKSVFKNIMKKSDIRNSTKSFKRTKMLTIVNMIAVIIISIILLIYIYIKSKQSLINYQPIDKENISVNVNIYEEIKDETTITKDEIESIQTFVFFGSDSRVVNNIEAGRSDTIMICSINPAKRSIKLISIPRDTYVYIPGFYQDKINHAYAFGQETLSLKTINQNFNLNIDKYITIDFAGLIDVIDAMGGIELTIDKDELEFINFITPGLVEYSKQKVTHLDSYGTVTLTGAQALAHSRNRSTGIGNDFARADRQRQVVTALFTKLSKMTYDDILKYSDLLLKDVKTNVTASDYTKIFLGILTKKGDYINNIISTQIPSTKYSQGQYINGIYYFVPDIDKARQDFIEYIFNK